MNAEASVPDDGGLVEGEPHEGVADPSTLEARLRRLEEIVASLEADEVDLERALELFEEGVGHLRISERILARAELRVEELLSDDREDENDSPTRRLDAEVE